MTVVYVSPTGNNSNSGLTPALAVATPAQGMVRARAIMGSVNDDVEVAFEGGKTHNVTQTIILSQADNRNNGRRLRFKSYGAGKAIITGRKRVTGWVDQAPGIVYAPLENYVRDLWCDGAVLSRATLGESNSFYRVYQWEQATKTLLINDALVPTVAQIAGLEMVIQMGWSISHMPVTSIVPSGIANFHRVSFEAKAASAEFAKGDLSAPGLGSTFAQGPYHNNLGQRFFWQNAFEFCFDPGDWYFDPVAQRVWARLPTGVANAAAFEALGVYVPNGQSFLSIPESYNFDTVPMVNNVDVTGIEFKNFGGVPVDWREGFIGYLNGASLYDNAGAIGYRFVPAVIGTGNCNSVTVTKSKFTNVSALAVRGQFAINGFRFEGNVCKNLEAGGVVIYGAVSGTKGGQPFSFDRMPVSAQNTDIFIENNAFGNIGKSLLGGAIFGGAARFMRIRRNTVIGCTDNGIEASNGSRHYGHWQRDIEISDNYIERVLTLKVDGAAIYVNGNACGYLPVLGPNPNDGTLGIRIFRNKIKTVRASGWDPAGGYAAAIYHDLGSSGNVTMLNEIDDVDLGLKTNCANANSFFDNRCINVSELANHSYAGANIYNPGTDTSFTVFPPLANPPSANDLDKFNGTNGFNSFKAVYPFATPQDVITPAGKYNSLGRLERNGSSVVLNLGYVGADQALVAEL